MKNRIIDMKSLMKIAFGLFAGICLMASCKDSDDDKISGFTLDTQVITLGAEGGTEKVNITAGTKWVAKVNKPWVKVMPANGVGSIECEIVVDTTLSNNVRDAEVIFVPEGASAQKLEIHQTGYGKMIGLSKEEVTVANMDQADKRYFEITVTSNVDFKIAEPIEGGWIKLADGQPNLSLDYGARPRTVKVRFKWDMNTVDQIREANIKFVPKDGSIELEKETKLLVKQDAAPTITDDRAGDSIALLICNTKLSSMTAWDSSERLEYWKGITLWEKTDEGVTEEMIGRVRGAEFRVLNTKESLPLELGKLKYIERLVVASNTNTMLLPSPFLMGDALKDLTYLRDLTIYAYGLTTINVVTDLKGCYKKLKYLDLSSNNFTAIPSSITATNLPELVSLEMSSMRRYSSVYDMQTGWREDAGMKVDVSYGLNNILKMENLRSLSLQYDYLYGKLPATIPGYNKKYTDADIAANDTLSSASPANQAKLKTIPRILPNIEKFAINLNFLTGDLPDWILYHPRFGRFNPFVLILGQEAGRDPDGNVPGFDNEPLNFDDFYEFYPKAKPAKTE